MYTYVEEADDDANKVSQRKRIGMKWNYSMPEKGLNLFDLSHESFKAGNR
jgi:hypothetical protein